MVVKKNAALIERYYHTDFLLFTNGKTMDFDEFLKTHQEIYATPIQYEIVYDEKAWVEQKERLAGRVFITIKRPEEPPREIEVILIVAYKEGKIFRLWELTYPDWSQLPAFKKQN